MILNINKFEKINYYNYYRQRVKTNAQQLKKQTRKAGVESLI